MHALKRSILIFLLFAAGLSLAWGWAKFNSSPPPTGESYVLAPGWPNLPAGFSLGQVSGVGVASDGSVFLFHRADRFWAGEVFEAHQTIQASTVLILDGVTGSLKAQWGANFFVIPHGLSVDHEDHLWLTDVGLHQVFKFDRSGNLLLTLGERGVPGDDPAHFNQPTDVAVSPSGLIYVSDGYVNSRIMVFSPEGQFLTAWGTRGSQPGQFEVPHSLAIDPHGQVYIADRGNARVQIFDSSGQFITAWQGGYLGRPWAVRLGEQGEVYLIDGGGQRTWWPDRARILKLDPHGNLLAAFGSYGDAPGQFIWPHAIAPTADGLLYVGEVATGMRVQKFLLTDTLASLGGLGRLRQG